MTDSTLSCESITTADNAPVSLSPKLTTALRMEGFEFTPAEVWGKLVEENTAFLEISATRTLAWVYQPETEAFLGERLELVGPPELAVPEALRQLELVLQAHGQSRAVPLMTESVWDTVAVQE